MDYGQPLGQPVTALYVGTASRRRSAQFWRALAGQYGWLVLALVVVMASCMPLAIQDIQWLDNVAILWPTALIAVVAGIVLANRQGRRAVDLLAGVILGAAGIFLVLGRVLPTWRRVGENTQALIAWIVQPFTGKAAANPIPHAVAVTFDRIVAFILQIISWAQSGGSGQPDIDNRIFLFLLSILTWGVTFYMAWALYRGVNPLAAIMPHGATLISLVVLGGQGSKFVVVFLVCAFLLVMRLHIMALERRWNRSNVDYPSSVSVELFATGAVFIVLVAALSVLLPAAPQNLLAVKFWAFFNGPWSTLEANVGEAFTGVRHKVGGNAGSDLFLGGSLSTSANTTVMYVTTDEPPPPDLPEEQLQAMGYSEPVHYFRGVAFTQYDGRGWGNDGKVKGRSHYGLPIAPDGEPIVDGAREVPQERTEDRLPNQPINPSPPGADKIVQQVEKVESRSAIMYAYDVPTQLDQPYTVHELGGAQTRIDLKGSSKKYQVVSEVLSPTAPQLRAAGTTYPDWIGPYLQLPSIPSRVADLAKQWTAQAATPYDKVHAIEENLRKIPYSTDIPPPGGHDAVDYFLFDAKQGYCEYYASAEVVMARSVGVPARVVSGYATTTYNRTKGAYEVDEADAHTWVQVYFPNIGWVDFEPTPINPEINRPEGANGESEASAPFIENPREAGVQRPPLIDPKVLVGAAAVMLVAFFAFAIRRQWEAELTAEAMIALVYGRMCRYAGWFGQRRHAYETSLEYGYRIADRFALVEEAVADQIRRIAVLFVLAQYAGKPLGEAEKQEAKKAWKAVRGRLWQLRRARVSPGVTRS